MEMPRRFFLAHRDSLHAKKSFANGCREVRPSLSSRAQARDLTHTRRSHKLTCVINTALVRSLAVYAARDDERSQFARFHFLSNTSTAFQASSGGACSYSSERSRYIFASRSSG